MPIRNTADFGTKTDYLYENFWEWAHRDIDKNALFSEFINAGIKAVRYIWPVGDCLKKFEEVNRGRIPVSTIDEHSYHDWNNRCPGPSKGLCAIMDIISQQIKRLHIVGMTFFNRFGYSIEAITAPNHAYMKTEKHNTGEHDFKKEIEFFHNITKSDKRVTTDEVLNSILGGL